MGKQLAGPLPSYRKPPIDEVACGCEFVNLDRMRLPHFGMYWQLVQHEFPTIEHAIPIVTDGNPTADSATGLPLPRMWLLDATETKLIQLQSDRLIYNWRKRPHAPDYPRFPQMIKSFNEHFQKLGSLASEYGIGPIQPKSLDLTYINVFAKGQEWSSMRDLGKIFEDLRWRTDQPRFLPSPDALLMQAEFPLPEGQGKLSVKLVPGKRVTDGTPVYSFQLTARGIGKDSSEAGMTAWFEMAREWIVRGFADLTDEKIQLDLWGRET